MPETIKDRWMKLCEQASHEMDSAKLMEIVNQINALMNEERRGKQQPTSPAPKRQARRQAEDG